MVSVAQALVSPTCGTDSINYHSYHVFVQLEVTNIARWSVATVFTHTSTQPSGDPWINCLKRGEIKKTRCACFPGKRLQHYLLVLL